MLYAVFWCVVQASLGTASCTPEHPPSVSLGELLPGDAYRTPAECLAQLQKWSQKWNIPIKNGKLVNDTEGDWYQCFPVQEGQFEAVAP